MVNLAEHDSGRLPSKFLSIGEALSGASPDPGVGAFLELRGVRNPAVADQTVVPPVLIPNPDLSKIAVVGERLFEFGPGAGQPIPTGDGRASEGKWGIKSDGG